MTLFQGTASTPSESAEAFGHMISLFGAVGDYDWDIPRATARESGSLAAAIAQAGGCEYEFEARLRNARKNVEIIAPHPYEVYLVGTN